MNWLQNSQEENLFVKNNIFVIMTTNHKDNITGPLLRSGRADLVIDIDNFDFYSHYNPETGNVESYMVSLEKQEIYLEACKKAYQFDKNEMIFTELSKNYDVQEIEMLATDAGFKCVAQFHDDNDYFADCLFEKL